MEPEYTSSTQTIFSNPRQNKIFQRLHRLVGSGPALFYEEACRLVMNESHYPSTTHLVSHLLREIESALRDVLEPFIDRETFTKKNGGEGHKEEILAVLKALEISQNDPIAVTWLGITGQGINSLNKRTHRNALDLPRPFDQEFVEFWSNMEAVLDKVLYFFETKYLVILDQLEKLRKKESPEQSDAEFLRIHIPNNVVAYNYFFKGLGNPAWLQPLQAEGLFSSPPEPIENKEEGTISFPQWPQSRYLVAMAPCKPELVSEIILGIETKNAGIQADFLEAICQLPPFLAAKHAEKICQWELNIPFLLGKSIGNLVSHLSKGKETKAAALLTKEFLRLKPNKKNDLSEKEEEISNYFDEPQTRVDRWEYGEFLKHNFPDFYKVAPREALSTVINALDDAILLFRHKEVVGFRDYSEFWRPAIEDNLQNHGFQDPRYELVSAIRDSAEYCITQDSKSLEEILHELEKKEWTVFRRLALHLTRLFGGNNSQLLNAYTLNESLFDYSPMHHEYVLLIKDIFSKLDESKQRKFLNWIREGPKIRPDEEDPKNTKEWWQLRWLTILKGQLPRSWEKVRQSLLKDKDEPENPDFLHWSGGVKTGPTSPVTSEELRAMRIENIVTFLQDWKVPPGFTMDSPEGVSRTLAMAISETPARFADEVEKFIGCDPTYVHGIFSGFQKALEAETPFDWHPVIRLMNWIVSQGKGVSGRQVSDAWDIDPDWGWTRTVIAGLLEKGFSSKKNQIPYKEDVTVWNVLQPLTDDSNPTESEDSETSMGPAMQSINTTRGTAFHSLIAYALWKKRNILKKEQKNEEGISFSSDMPEVLAVLEKHLDTNQDPSPSIRAVYGWRFSNLAYLDHKWAIANKDRIFPKNLDESKYWNAAWSSCVGFNGANKNMFQDLYAEYLHSTSSIETSPMKLEMGNNPNERLVEHLILYYAWNDIELDSEMMTTFWNNSTPDLRNHAIRFIGKAEKGVSPEIIARLKRLWETRLHIIHKAEVKEPFFEELKAFGWVFVSESFDDEWILSQLAKVLAIIGEIDNDHGVVERLALLSEKYPNHTVKMIGRLVEGDKKGWGPTLWNDNIKIILTKALLGNDSEAKKEAEVLINRLAVLGYSDYKDLLES
jgi:hypothetical protein